MKKNKSPDSTVITPTKKGLIQARLPFKPISDVSPKTTPQGRKRKLFNAEEEAAAKIVKLSKENDDIVISDSDVVILSDDDSRDGPVSSKDDQKLNPYVKLVDNVLKRKNQKKKNLKKQSKTFTNVVICPEKTIEALKNDDLSDNRVDIKEKDGKITLSSNSNQSVVSPRKLLRSSLKSKSPTAMELDCVNGENSQPSATVKDLSEHQNKLIKTVDDKSMAHESTENGTGALAPPCSIVTPKRSSRKKVKVEDKLDTSSSSSKMDDSISSTPTTPRQSRSSSVTNSQGGDDSLNNSSNVTPKEIQKKLESAKKKEDREKERLEREKKRQQEKEERAKQKQEKEEQRKREREEKEEAKKKEKEEKEEQRRKEKEEKDKQRELEKKQKEEKEEQKRKEKEEKELQKRKEKEAKEEEKRKKQEAVELERQEQELKKKKAAEAFVNFFVPKQKVDQNEKAIETSKNCMLSTFTIKVDMRLAPTTRHSLSDESKSNLDVLIGKQNLPETKLYVKALRKGMVKPLYSGKTWPASDKDHDDDDVMIVEDELPPLDGVDALITCEPAIRENLHPKLLSFHENRRPPYFGTWRKKSSFVKPRRPFAQDEKLLDYECDSDEEWEEEQEGESIDGSAAGSEDEQEADEYEVDNEVFVPHGYLSDEEATMDEDDVLSMSPEAQKQKLKHLEEEFESELKKPTEKLKPRLYGLLWATNDGGKPDNCVDILWNYFDKLAMIMNDPTPFMQPSINSEDTEKKKVKKKKAKVEGETKNVSPKQEKKKITHSENKEPKKPKQEKKAANEMKKNQPAINSFLTKFKPS